ncbi:MAG: phosphatase PAP2 family protein [Limisphaerales bacterium]
MPSSVPLRSCFCILLISFLTSQVVHGAVGGVEMAGDILQYVLPATAATLTLAYKDEPGAIQFGESVLLSQGVTYGLKYGLNERRPNGGDYSMPSGHTSISFTAAEFMRKRYGWEYGVPAYALASFVAYSRVESHNHWPKDVVAGAAIGIASSYIFTRPYHGWKIEPEVSIDQKHSRTFWGLQLSRAW